MTQQSNRRMLYILAIATAALVVLAAGISRLELHEGRALPWGDLRNLVMQPGAAPVGDGSAMLGPWRVLMTFVVWVLFPMLVISLIVWPEVRRKVLRRVLMWTIWTVFIYLLVQALQSRNQGGQAGGAGTSNVQNPDAAHL